MTKFVKIATLLTILALGISGCTSTDEGKPSSAQSTSRSESVSIDKAYPYIYEKGFGYKGILSAREIHNCSLSLQVEEAQPDVSTFIPLNSREIWDPKTPIVKNSSWYEKLKANAGSGEQNAIGEISMTLLHLLQAYHPDKIGMGLFFDSTTNKSGISLVGNNPDEETSWDEIIKKLDIPQDKGTSELAGLISSKSPKVLVRYVKNSTEELCRAAQEIRTDLFGTSYIDPENHRMAFDAQRGKIKFSLRRGTQPFDSGLLDPSLVPPITIAEIDYTVDLAKLISTKYESVMYYSEL